MMQVSAGSLPAGNMENSNSTHPLESPLESIKLALYGGLQQVLHIQVHVVLLVVICDGLAGPFSFQVHSLHALAKVGFLLNLRA